MLGDQCPYLGLSQDPDTFVGFPDLRNHCHRASPAEPVDLDYQRMRCFSQAHRNCPVLLSSVVISLPAEISALPKSNRNHKPLSVIFLSALILVVVASILFGGWRWAAANGWFGEPTATRELPVLDTPALQQVFPNSLTPTVTPANWPATHLPAATSISAPQSDPAQTSPSAAVLQTSTPTAVLTWRPVMSPTSTTSP